MDNHRLETITEGLLFMLLILNLALLVEGDWPIFHHDVWHTGYTDEYSEYRNIDLILFWNFTVNGSILSSPVVDDLDFDGREEVVFGSDDGSVYALDYKGNLLWSYKTGGPVRSTPTLGNLTGGDTLQVVVGSDDGSVYAFEHNGSLLWKFETKGRVTSSPVITDIVNGPRPGVVFGSWDGNLYILHSDGSEFWRYYFGAPIEFPPTMVDIDGNGFSDIVFISVDKINALSFFPFKIIVSAAEFEITTPPVAEGREIIVGSHKGRVYRFTRQFVGVNESVIPTKYSKEYWFNHTKDLEVLASEAIFNCSESVYSTPAFANLDFDVGKKNNYVFGCDDGNLYILSPLENNTNARIIRYTTSKAVKSSPALVDLNNDKSIEIVFGSDDGYFYVLNATGFGRWGYYVGGRVVGSPAISDLDHDDFVEVIVGSTNGVLYCFGSKTSVLKSEGKSYYDIARNLLDLRDFENSTDYGLKAMEVYESVNCSACIEDVDDLFLDVSAKEHCKNARDFYNTKLFKDAVDEIETADLIYYNAKRPIKSECNDLLTIARANYYYYEAAALLDNGLLEDAKEYADKSQNFSIRSGDSTMTVQSQLLVEKVVSLQEAQDFFTEVVRDYRSNESIGDVLVKLNQAEKIYDTTNVSSSTFKRIRKQLTSIRSELYFRNISMLLDMSEFEDAYELALETKRLCASIENSACAEKADAIINKTQIYVEGKGLLEQAKRYYTATDFITSANYARRAKERYTLAGNNEKILEADDILNRSLSMMEKISTGKSWTEELSNPVVIALALEVAVAVVILFTRPRGRVLFRGYIGPGESVKTSKIGYSGFGSNFWATHRGRKKR